MTEERLKEIKDNIDLDFDLPSTNESIVIEELYNEVVRLKEILEQNNLTLEQLTGVENE